MDINNLTCWQREFCDYEFYTNNNIVEDPKYCPDCSSQDVFVKPENEEEW